MLHIKIDLVPLGIEEARSTLDNIYVCNDGSGSSEHGNYDIYVEDPRGRDYPRDERPGWVGRLEKFPRSLGRRALAEQALATVRSEGWKAVDPA